MKTICTIITSIFILSLVHAQSTEESIQEIRAHYQWINAQKDYETLALDGLEYMDFVPDNGASLEGYYKNDTLYKIVDWFGISYAILVTEYYFWDEQLFFVYHTEKSFKTVEDDKGNFVRMDYTATELKYEDRHYYAGGKEIRRIEKGDMLLPKSAYINDFYSHVEGLKGILNSKPKPGSTLSKLQGRWVSEEDKNYVVEINNQCKFDYYSGQLSDEADVRVEKNYLFSRLLKDEVEDKYEILKLTDRELQLLFIPAGRILRFTKELN